MLGCWASGLEAALRPPAESFPDGFGRWLHFALGELGEGTEGTPGRPPVASATTAAFSDKRRFGIWHTLSHDDPDIEVENIRWAGRCESPWVICSERNAIRLREKHDKTRLVLRIQKGRIPWGSEVLADGSRRTRFIPYPVMVCSLSPKGLPVLPEGKIERLTTWLNGAILMGALNLSLNWGSRKTHLD